MTAESARQRLIGSTMTGGQTALKNDDDDDDDDHGDDDGHHRRHDGAG